MTNLVPIVDTTPMPLATAAEFQRRYPMLCQDGPDANELQEMCVEASANIEERTNRRLAPFSGHYFSDRLEGIDPDGYGVDVDTPLDISGSLGLSQAAAYGANNLVRDFYLDQTAPHRADLWTYSIQSITLRLAVGSSLTVNPLAIEGPQSDTGHCRLPLGTFAPVGTTIEVVFGGGYTLGIPAGLRRACLLQVAKDIILTREPQSRQGFSLTELEDNITNALAPWAR